MNFFKNHFSEYAFNPPPAPPDYVLQTFYQNAEIRYITKENIPVVVVQRLTQGLTIEKKKLIIRLVYTHGNSELIYYVYPRLLHIADHIFSRYKDEFDVFVTVVGWTYPGFHPFLNTPLTRENIEKTSFLIWGELPSLDGFTLDSEHIVIEIAMGYSIGTYPASILNSHPTPPSILFLVTPFSKLPSGAGMYTSLEAVTGPLFDNYKYLNLKTPSVIFLLYGQADTTLPFHLNKELTTIKGVKYIVSSDYKHEDFGTQIGVHHSLTYLCDQIDDVIEAPDCVISDVVIPIRTSPSPDVFCNLLSVNEMLKEVNITPIETTVVEEEESVI